MKQHNDKLTTGLLSVIAHAIEPQSFHPSADAPVEEGWNHYLSEFSYGDLV